MNLLASDSRLEIALGEDPGTLGHQLLNLVEKLMPPKPSEVVGALRPLFPRLISTRIRHTSPEQPREMMSSPDLTKLPILQTWPDDAGKFITLPQVFTYDPQTNKRNLGMYRMQVFGPAETGMHWQIQKGGGFHYHRAEAMNEPLEVAVAVGTDPALLIATIAPLPEGIDEVMFSGFLRGRATQMTRGRSIGITVPTNAEFLLEGTVAPHDRRREGPFGDHFGHYSHAGMFPVFKLRAITHVPDPVFAATVVGKPPMEDKWLGDVNQLILGPLAKLNHPEVRDVWAFYEAGFHNLLGIAMEQRYAKEAMKTAMSVATDGQLSLTKCAIVVNGQTNNRDFRSLVRAIRDNFDPHYDFLLVQNVPLDTLDFTSYTMNMGSKMLIDATQKMPSTASGGNYPTRRPNEFYERTGRAAQSLPDIDSRIREYRVIEEALLVVKVAGAYTERLNAATKLESEIDAPQRTVGRDIVERLTAPEIVEQLPKGVKIVAAVSEDVNLSSDMEVMWGIFTRFDAARDVCFTRSRLNGISVTHEGIMGIDATWKTGYPNPCIMPDEVLQKVDARWGEYGFR
jgi:4-hydroxy-3-polyprenylbenzoate decarboxylase